MATVFPEPRARILAAAAAVLREQGPRTRLITTIAERAQVSRPTLYRYFPHRSDIYDSLIRVELTRVIEDVATRADSSTSPFEDYVDMVVDLVKQAREHAALQAVLKRHPEIMASHLSHILPITLEIGERRLAPVLSAGVAAGRWPAIDLRIAITWTVRLVNSLITMPLPDDADEESLRRQIAGAFQLAAAVTATAH
jgi:AcrR family transcriptional regulator